jgi:hypothetical protein
MKSVKQVRVRRLSSIFHSVRRLISTKFPGLASVTLFVGCPEAERSHSTLGFTKADKKGHSRLYCHWNHVPNNICCSSHFHKELKDDEITGMLLHEFGHAIADELKVNNTQDAADGLIWKYFKIPIYYRMPRRIQYVTSLKPQRLNRELKTRLASNPWYITDKKGVVKDETPFFTKESAEEAISRSKTQQVRYSERPVFGKTTIHPSSGEAIQHDKEKIELHPKWPYRENPFDEESFWSDLKAFQAGYTIKIVEALPPYKFASYAKTTKDALEWIDSIAWQKDSPQKKYIMISLAPKTSKEPPSEDLLDEMFPTE